MDERIVQYADEAATALAADPELCLLLHREVISHASEKVHVYLKAGSDWEESVGLALREMGTPGAFAAAWQRTHAATVRQRARMRLALWLLLPVVLLVYGWVQYVEYVRLTHAVHICRYLQGVSSDSPNVYYDAANLSPILQDYFPAQPAKQREENLLLFGDLTRAGLAAQRRAIWEAQPDNKVFFAYYFDGLVWEGVHSPRELAHFRKEAQLGMKLDPTNAFYHYMLADALAGQAISHYGEKPGIDKKSGKTIYAYQVKDRQLFDEAMHELLIAVRLPEMKTYHFAMMQAQFAQLPSPRHLEDDWLRLTIAITRLFPEQPKFRALAWVIPYYAHLSVMEGRRDNAEEIAQLWHPLVKHLTANSHSIIELLVINAVVNISADGDAGIYDELGEHAKVQQLRSQQKRLIAPIIEYRATQHDQGKVRHLLYEYGAIELCPLLPLYSSYFTIDELAPLRNLEYVLMELLVASLLPTILLVMLIYAWLAGMRWGMAAEGVMAAPFTALLPAKTLLRIIGLSVLLPLAIYYLFTRESGLAGREHSIMATFIVLIPAEILGLAVLLLVLPMRMAKRAICRHCEALGIPVPPRGYRRCRSFLSGAWSFIWVMLFLFVGIAGTTATIIFNMFGILRINSIFPIVFTCLLVASVLFPGVLKWQQAYGQFYGIVAKTLIPIYALTLLLFSLTALPYLSWNEQYWLRQDRLLFAQPVSADYPTVESRCVKLIQAQVLNNEEKVERDLSK